MSEEVEPEPSPDDKIILKKEAMKIVGVSLRTFNRIRDQLKEQFQEEPLIIWNPTAKHLASLYSLNDVRTMVKLKALRVPGRKPKVDPEPEEKPTEDEKYQDFLSRREE